MPPAHSSTDGTLPQPGTAHARTMTLNRPTQQARSGRSSATTRLMVVQQEDRTSPGRSQTGSSPRHDKRLSPHDRPIPEDLTCRSTRQSLRQSRGSGTTPSLTQSLPFLAAQRCTRARTAGIHPSRSSTSAPAVTIGASVNVPVRSVTSIIVIIAQADRGINSPSANASPSLCPIKTEAGYLTGPPSLRHAPSRHGGRPIMESR